MPLFFVVMMILSLNGKAARAISDKKTNTQKKYAKTIDKKKEKVYYISIRRAQIVRNKLFL